jgi:hypothetical protein
VMFFKLIFTISELKRLRAIAYAVVFYFLVRYEAKNWGLVFIILLVTDLFIFFYVREY